MEQRKDGKLQGTIEKRLAKLVDPETGLDVMRMGLIGDLQVRDGNVSLVFRPKSRLFRNAFRLGADIHDAVRSLPGVQRLVIRVEGLERAGELERALNSHGDKPEEE